MQGDYMRLNYAVTTGVDMKPLAENQKRGDMVIRVDEQRVAHFVRFYQGELLKNHEKILHFHRVGRSLRIVPDAFFFQEDHAQYYDVAKYGVFKFDQFGQHILVALADEQRRRITITE